MKKTLMAVAALVALPMMASPANANDKDHYMGFDVASDSLRAAVLTTSSIEMGVGLAWGDGGSEIIYSPWEGIFKDSILAHLGPAGTMQLGMDAVAVLRNPEPRSI